MAGKTILLLSAVLFIGTTSARSPRIINGHDAEIEDFPHQISLRFQNQHFCGGSIISERHILTAAHCIIDGMIAPYTNFRVVTGTAYRLRGGMKHKIANVTIHEGVECDENRCTRDIALITLEDTIVFNERQQKIKLSEKNYDVGAKAILTGWGAVEKMPTDKLAIKLQKLETNLISMGECQKKVIDPEKTEIFEAEICALHSTGTGACAGDSGGPLVVNGELVGIAAWVDGPQCAVGRPDVFTNVYKYLNFIKSATNQAV